MLALASLAVAKASQRPQDPLSTALASLSSSQDSMETFEELLFQNDYQDTGDAIYQAIQSCRASPLLFDILIGYGATVSESDLQFALDKRRPELLDALLSAAIGQGIEDFDGIFERLFESLTRRPGPRSSECLIVLLKRGLEITDRTFCSILEFGALDLLITLTDEGYRIPDIAVLQAIKQAPIRGLGPLRLLLELGGSPNASYYSILAIESAIQSPSLSFELTQLLIEYGATFSPEKIEPANCSAELIGLLYGPPESLSQRDLFALMVNGVY